MKVPVKSKIVIFVYLVCHFEALCSKINEKSVSRNFKESTYQGIQNIVKRNADWSKRISPILEKYGHIAAESENIEVITKRPTTIRRVRVQNGKKESIEDFQKINPENRSNNRITKIVRVKKIIRKNTIAPDIAIRNPTAATRKSMVLSPTTIPKTTFSSPYAHITVINKEFKNPKMKKKNKKTHKYYMVSTPFYDNEGRKNGLISESPQLQFDSQLDMYELNTPYSYPQNAGYNNMYDQVQRMKLEELVPNRKDSEYFNIPKISDKYKNINKMIAKTTYPLFMNDQNPDESFYPKMDMIHKKHIYPPGMFNPYEDIKDIQIDYNMPSNENLKESSSQLKEIINKSAPNSTEAPIKFGDKLKSIEHENNNSSSNSTSTLKESTVTLLVDEITNKTEIPVTKPETEHPPQVTPSPKAPNVKKMIPPQNKFPMHFPSLLFGEQNAFSDPFFDTPEIPPPRRPGMFAWNYPLSPFHPSDNSENDGYFSNGEVQTHQSDDLMLPGFPHSPNLASLRSSILDVYGAESTTSEPVTPYSLPKFEIPSIDFNDKGCQTVYKEVKTVPKDGSPVESQNQKSFVMSRECYFPNGVPTTEQTKKIISTDRPITLDALQMKSKS